MEAVLGGADGGEGLGVAGPDHAQTMGQLRRAQKGIGRLLGRDGGRDGGFAARAGGEDRLASGDHRRIVVEAEREARVGGGVLVGAIDHGLVGQGSRALQAAPELRRVAFEHPPAAEGEQAVADEGDPVRGVEIGDVAKGMPADVDHLERRLAERHAVTRGQDAVGGRDAGDLGRADDLGAGGGLEGGVAPCVVGVPVSVEDHVQGPAGGGKLALDRRGVGRVDGRDPSFYQLQILFFP